jgi:hypothetical protein
MRFALSLFFTAALVSAADKPAERTIRLQWRDLGRATQGHRIALKLPSGIKLEGDPIAFEDDELVLDVRKTSDKRAYPKGRSIVPRPEVQRLRIIKTRRTGRAAGAAIGGGAGALLAVPLVEYLHNEGGNAGLAGLLAVAIPAGLGYVMGWATDVKQVQVEVEPDR